MIHSFAPSFNRLCEQGNKTGVSSRTSLAANLAHDSPLSPPLDIPIMHPRRIDLHDGDLIPQEIQVLLCRLLALLCRCQLVLQQVACLI